MKSYDDMVKTVLALGRTKHTRGAKTLSLFNYSWMHDMSKGFPLVTSKWMPWKSILIENLWFLSGNPYIDALHRHGVHFWDNWADSEGRIDSPYGFFWRQYPQNGPNSKDFEDSVDQLARVIDRLKTDPLSRRNVITAWDPRNVQGSKLPPCHIMQIFHVDEMEDGYRLNLHVTQRSADIAIGVPFNMAGYGLILSLVARFAGMTPGCVAITFVDAHIYTKQPYDHRDGLRLQINREPVLIAPELEISPSISTLEDTVKLLEQDTDEVLELIKIKDYHPHGKISFKALV